MMPHEPTSLSVPDASANQSSISPTPSLFSVLSRTTYVPPPSSPTSRSPKETFASGQSRVDPKVLDTLGTGNKGVGSMQPSDSSKGLLDSLNSLSVLPQQAVYFSPAAAFDKIGRA